MESRQIPIDIVNANRDQVQSQESEWSLSSLQQLKGLTLQQMRDDEIEAPENDKPKTQKTKQIAVQYPPKQIVTPATNLFLIGKVIQLVGQLYIVKATSHDNIVDLNSCIFDENKKCWGFVIDVLGRVDQPFYAIKQFPAENKILCEQVLGKDIYYAQGCKTLTEQDIKSIEGKRAADYDIQSDSQEDQKQQFSEQPFRKDNKRHKNRRNSFQQRPNYRQRTRQNKQKRYEHNYDNRFNRPPQFQMPPNNQQYLQNMYTMHYQQMMQMQGHNNQGMMPPFFPQMPPPK